MTSPRRRQRGQRGAGLTIQQQDVLNFLHPRLRELLDLKEILPHLNQQRLLSRSEQEKLKNEHFTTHERIDELLGWIPRKGPDALARFIECLRNSADGTGHDELANLLEDEVRQLNAGLEQSEGPTSGQRAQHRNYKNMSILSMRSTGCQVFSAAIIICIAMYIPYIHHRRLWVDYSHSLLDYVPHFLGRDKEISDLVMLLDPENTDVRIVSIVGPPGFGKSSLATHVGHAMIDSGVVVNYVNLDEVTIDDIPEKIIGNAGITTKNYSIDRLIKWAKDEVKHPVLIILDNCDVILHENRDKFQKILQHVRRSTTTMMIKFLLTTKHKINLVDEFEEYCLEEISFEASCMLLHHMTKVQIDEQKCRSITKLTGNVPLALKVVGAILRTRTRNITRVISNLEKKLLKTLSPSDLDQKVNASLMLSYKYLGERQKRLGQYLALFPGSFTLHDACIILDDIMESDCNSITADIEVLDQRSLLQSLGKGRYHFHKITKEFFSFTKQSHDTDKNTSAFWTKFLVRYGNKLYHLSVIYENDYASALHTLGIEKHNFQYLLEHSKELCLMDLEQSLSIFDTLQVALKMRFLTSQFTIFELKEPFSNICRCLLHIIPAIKEVELGLLRSVVGSKQAQTVMRAMEVLIHITVDFYGFHFHDIVQLEEVRVQLDTLENIVHVPAAADFYHVLGSHYHDLGELEKEKRCHEKILQRADAQLHNCMPGFCDYNSISRAYYHLGKYELGAHFLELDLKYNGKRMSQFVLLNTLELLHTCQSRIGNRIKAKATLERLLPVLPSLMNASVPDIYSNLEILSSVTFILRANGMTNEATQLEKKQIMAIKEMNATETRFDKSFAIKASVLATTFFEAKQYDEVPEVAECALKLMKKQNKKYIREVIELQLILGKAEYNNGKRSASIRSLKDVARTVVYEHPLYYNVAKEACQYMLAQAHLDATCLPLIWRDLKTIGYSVLMLIVSDTIPVSSHDQQNEAFSTDVAQRSNYLDIFPSVVATPLLSLYNLYTSSFSYPLVFIISTFLLRVLNIFLVPAKLFFFCVCCNRSFYFLIGLLHRMCRVCIQI